MHTIKNKDNLHIPPTRFSIDDIRDLPFVAPDPLHKKSFFYYVVGAPKSGKSVLWFNLIHAKGPTKKKPNNPRFYFKSFDHIYLFSNSINTLDNKKLKIHDDRKFSKYDFEVLEEILDEERNSGDNNNILIIFDDVIKDIQNSKKKNNQLVLSKSILNRRHICHNEENEDKKGGLSIMIISQKYNLLPTEFRNAINGLFMFKSQNQQELNTIYNEYASDLSQKEWKDLLEFVFDKPYNFLFLKADEPKLDKYYKNFDKIVFNTFI